MKTVKHTLISLTILLYGLLNNSTAQWVEQPTGITFDLNSISSPDDNTCWASGENGTVLRTTNGGLNWQTVGEGPLSVNSINNIFAIDANIALVSTYINPNAVVFKTTNGGANWIQVFSQLNGFINSIWMTSDVNGFMMGDPVGGRWSLWKTTNGGVNWDSAGLRVNKIGTEYGWNNGMFVLGNQIWFNTYSTRIYYSDNNGADWRIQTTSESLGNGTVWFNSPNLGMSSGVDIAFSSNAGNTWDMRNLQNNFIMGIMGKGNNFWECEVNVPSRIQMSSDGGLNWIVEYQPTSGQPSHITSSRNGNTGWVCMTNGIIARRTSLVGITPISNEIPKQFYVSQNYPNPFNPITKIKIDVPKSSTINISIYDISGRHIETIANQSFNAGKYDVSWDASKYTSGIYFCKLNTEEYSKTIKMLLIK